MAPRGQKKKSGQPGDADDSQAVSVKQLLIPRSDYIPVDQISGMARERGELERQIIGPQNYPGLLQTAGQGILMYGPPGTGKTYFSMAIPLLIDEVQGEESTLLFNADASNLRSHWEGMTERNIRKLWELAQEEAEKQSEHAITVVFIDEFETLAADRSKTDDKSTRNIVVTLLQTLDGARRYDNVLAVTATNHPQQLDPAILSRFPFKMFIDLPDDTTRRNVIATLILNRLEPSAADKIRKSMRRRSSRKRSRRLGVDMDVWNGILDYLTEITGWQKGTKAYLSKQVTMMGHSKDDVNALFAKNPRVESNRAIHDVGFTQRDLKQVMTRALNDVGYSKLYDPEQYDGDCHAMDPPEVWINQVENTQFYRDTVKGHEYRHTALNRSVKSAGVPVCPLSRKDRKKMYLTLDDLDNYFPAMGVSFETFRPSTNVDDYMQYILYAIQS